MKKIFTLIAMAVVAMSANAQEKVLFTNGGTYGNGAELSSESTKLVLGNDRTTKNYDIKLASVKAYCAELFGQTVEVKNDETGEMEEKTRVVYVVGNQNPKDGELDGNSSTGTTYSPETANLPQSGCYYMITTSKSGKILAFIVLNADKNFYIAKKSTGQCFAPSEVTIKADGEEATEVTLGDDYKVSEKTTGTVEFAVEANETYYVFCTGSKLSFGGYIFTEGGSAGINVVKAESDNVLYNLAGQKVDAGYKGLVIKNGRKYMK